MLLLRSVGGASGVAVTETGSLLAKSLLSCLCGIALATPAAAQQRPHIPVRSATPAQPPLRLPAPRPGDAALETTTVSRVSIAEEDNLALGVGLFSVSGQFVRGRGARGREPLIDTGGRQSRVAAVGFSLRF